MRSRRRPSVPKTTTPARWRAAWLPTKQLPSDDLIRDRNPLFLQAINIIEPIARIRQDLVERGWLLPSHNGKDRDGGGMADAISDDTPQLDDLAGAIPEDVISREEASGG